jgi:hypothetical protein
MESGGPSRWLGCGPPSLGGPLFCGFFDMIGSWYVNSNI